MTTRRRSEPAGVSPQALRLALARLPAEVRDATRVFQELTGFTAVTSFASTIPDDGAQAVMLPPMHPLCASRWRGEAGQAPCQEEWQRHLQRSLASRDVQGHICPLGLVCACIPIYCGGMLAGVAKCVTSRRTDTRRLSRALRVLELAIGRACQDLLVDIQSRDLQAMRVRMDRLQDVLQYAEAQHLSRPAARRNLAAGVRGRAALVETALDYIGRHYRDGGTTLARISRELGVTERYLTSLFTRAVGQRMHAYILHLRVQHARGELLNSRKPIKQIAYESGFNDVDTFRRSFHRYAGVAPSAYRTAFARG